MKRKLLSICLIFCLGFLGVVLFPGLSFAVIYADTDGDGTTDQVSVCGSPAKVCVYHPNTGQTNTYYDAYWQSFSINSVIDTDGIAGAEIIVVWTTSSGSNKGIDVIHDRVRTYSRYSDAYWQSFAVNSVVDTDGTAGAEIIVVWTTSSGSPKGIDVIRDRVRTWYRYSDGYWQSFAINRVVDTDGIAGAEIIVLWTTSSGSNKGIDIIHDRNINFNRYDYSFANSYSIQNVKNYDGIAGAEVCVYWWQSSTYYGYHLIIDRTRTVQNRSSCS